MWEKLRHELENLQAFRRVVRELGGDAADVSACGLYGSARSLVLAALAASIGEQILVIAPDPVKARDIEGDLKIFGLEGVVPYPEDEILPYDYHEPDRSLKGYQMKALEALSLNRCRVLVCTLRSACKKVYSPDIFRNLLIDLELDQQCDPVELCSGLVRIGYERQEIVEEKGQFALRGGILDIFEVGCQDPVRMEFDGDEICTMRDFDIETQRSTGSRRDLRIRPLHHLAPTSEGIERLRRRLEIETAGMSRLERGKMLLPVRRFEKGIPFYGMENYTAAVHDVVSLLEYFDRPPLLVLFDAEDLETVSRDFREEIERRYERTKQEGRLYPRPDEVYVSEAEFEKWAEGTKRLRFHKLGWDGAIRFGSKPPGDYRRNLKGLLRDVERDIRRGMRVFLFCSNPFQRERAEELLPDIAINIDFLIGDLSSGFRFAELGVLFLSEEEVFGRFHRPYHLPRSASRSLTYDPSHFKPGEFVVHVNHGVGRYMGLKVLSIEGGQTECIDVRYAGKDHLFIPVAQLRMVEKYVAAEGVEPPLSKLGSVAWARAREKARRSAESIAKDLLEIYAERQITRGFTFAADKPWQKEMEATFRYEETLHQLQATSEVKEDMESARPMDRLLCGDVGFGKTEVAVRAAFKTVLSGKQCAFLVPTTVLAMQHYNTIMERLRGFPVNVAMLSRFISTTSQKRTVAELSEGRIDLVVGTHRLLSKDVRFKDLGLVIVDEEHRFGVRHKEKFKKMKRSIDVLSMTATPIPRTLSMAISGIRDISVIDTPPRNRLPIHTEILPFDDESIREAVVREVDRGGQVFFVHNRVQSIGVMEGYLRRLLPERVRISHAHGQMKERDLEQRMIDFLGGEFDVLVCTMIIEAGLDFPNVNTIIINRADKFGLAQLYQLRGRVGRSDRKAFAYMLVPGRRSMSAAAVRRLQAISEFDYLGAGYRIAMRDLEIRGAGNLLGPQQSGHINAIGLDLYSRMLKEEVARLKGEPATEEKEISLSVPLPAYFPQGYIRDSEERMDIYRRLMRIEAPAQVAEMHDELRDRFGPAPRPAENMLKIVELKVRARSSGIARVELSAEGTLHVVFRGGNFPPKGVLAGIADLFTGRLTFHTEDGFSLSIGSRPREKGDESGGQRDSGPRGAEALTDLESLLKLLEFCDK